MQKKGPRLWDKKWRVIIFDIPEKRRSIRDKFRMMLRELGYYRLQDSVWIFPYSTEELVSSMKRELGESGTILHLLVEKTDDAEELEKFFKLK